MISVLKIEIKIQSRVKIRYINCVSMMLVINGTQKAITRVKNTAFITLGIGNMGQDNTP